MYQSPELKSALTAEIATGKYNLIHAETFYVMPNIPQTSLPIILVVQTIEHLGYKEFTKRLGNPLLKPFFYWDVQKIKHWEELYWRTASRLIAMSDEDKSYIQRRTPDVGDISVVANGVDVEFFNEVPKSLSDEFVVLFVGTFKWLPNVEAVTYLVENVWEKIKLTIPKAKLWIVGNSPTDKIQSYMANDTSIVVKGRVSDIRDAYKRANVLLAPVWSGKGTRYKILEAMATATPIVATPLAVEGLAVENGVHALLGKTSQELADATIRLYQDKKLAASLAQNGKRLVASNYEWESIAQKLDQVYQGVGR
jgi:polysaccharide biosynthesis protein PslH